MRKFFIYGIALVSITAVAAFSMNLDINNGKLPLLTLANVEALANESHPPGGSTEVICYSTINRCWFWDCSNIYRCNVSGICETESADGWSDSGKCYP